MLSARVRNRRLQESVPLANAAQRTRQRFPVCASREWVSHKTVGGERATSITVLKHLLWNVHWQAEFLPTDFANIAAAWTIIKTGGKLGNTANVSAVANGGPGDARFTSIITAAGAPNCNAVATAAAAAPNIRENAKWATFDVTR